jgi:hypothetical protein
VCQKFPQQRWRLGTLYEKAILKSLDDIRPLTHFPELVRRQAGLLADHIK